MNNVKNSERKGETTQHTRNEHQKERRFDDAVNSLSLETGEEKDAGDLAGARDVAQLEALLWKRYLRLIPNPDHRG